MQDLRHENFPKTDLSKDIDSRLMMDQLETVPFLKVSTSSKTHTNTYTLNIFSKPHSLYESLEKSLSCISGHIGSKRSRNLQKEVTIKSQASWTCRNIGLALNEGFYLILPGVSAQNACWYLDYIITVTIEHLTLKEARVGTLYTL